MGFLLEAIFSSKGKFVISEDEILKISIKGFKKSTDSKSKGVDKKLIFLFLQYSDNNLYSLKLNRSYFENKSN